jgi:dihydroorotate dehydrogenase
LLVPLADERQRQTVKLGRPLPLLVKLAPDLSSAELDDALDVILATGMDGVIAANTSIKRGDLRSPQGGETGGLSGAPIRQLNTDFVRAVTRRTSGRLPIIASGGIMCPDDVKEKIDAGAVLIQLYTGLIYAGPGLVRQVLEQAFAPASTPLGWPVHEPVLRPGYLAGRLPTG